MVSLTLAIELKQAGLIWQPELHDFFAIPQPELEDRLFVLSDMTIDIQPLFGWQALTFNGAVEWSLDYIMTAEVVWVPTESQLREMLQERLLAEEQPAVQLLSSISGYHCQITYEGELQEFEAATASDAYGQALLFLVQGGERWLGSSGMEA
jgi:hypothetical protein